MVPVAPEGVGLLFYIHLFAASALAVSIPFTKLAHVIYRPIALWMAEFRRLRTTAD